ncbi:hypothetical protein LOK49_LG02G01412 [Camellia lanceoleosa]|uniref:Uncharacterized protein n=1 Tax=Camellia lanceoleosa TaxID=1840588 RepID=A0ACC0IPF0_9ERIC|nr:hypothetical protein LOK49_LG02G01412 [Camellia lanceoleosa]
MYEEESDNGPMDMDDNLVINIEDSSDSSMEELFMCLEGSLHGGLEAPMTDITQGQTPSRSELGDDPSLLLTHPTFSLSSNNLLSKGLTLLKQVLPGLHYATCAIPYFVTANVSPVTSAFHCIAPDFTDSIAFEGEEEPYSLPIDEPTLQPILAPILLQSSSPALSSSMVTMKKRSLKLEPKLSSGGKRPRLIPYYSPPGMGIGIGIVAFLNNTRVGSLFKSLHINAHDTPVASVLYALKWAKDNNYNHVNVFTNAKFLFEQLKGTKDIEASLVSWIFDICFVTQHFHSCKISLACTNYLHSARRLARFATFSRIPAYGDAHFPFDNG